MCDSGVQCAPSSTSVALIHAPKLREPSTPDEARAQIADALGRRRRCCRCAVWYSDTDSLGRLQCMHHPVKCGCGGEDDLHSPLHRGCVSVDHAENELEACKWYAVMPLAVWQEIVCGNLSPNCARMKCRRERSHEVLRVRREAPVQVVYVLRVEDVSQGRWLRVHFFGAPHDDERILPYQRAYDECAAIFGFAPFESVPVDGDVLAFATPKKRRRRPLGDSTDAHSTLQRELFDLEALENDALPDACAFVPFVIILRTEVRHLRFEPK